MAYLPQNPQDLQKQLDSQVLGQSSQGQQPQQQQAPVGGASQPSTIEGSQPGQAPQAPAPKKASSGQFTNLKSYLQASQGAGQKIGQQLTGGMQRQAQQIGQAVQQQKAQYQAQVGQQEAAREQAARQAQNILQQAQSLETAQPLSQENIAQFRELATGQKTFKDVQDMNLTAQQVAQQQLAQKAENLKTFEGRTGQLRETFGKQRQYGTGSSALDTLLLQSQGLPQVLGQAAGITQSAKESIKGAEQFGRNELARLIAENKEFQKGLQSQSETAQGKVISDIDALRAQRAAERAAQLQQEINPLLTKEQQELADLEKAFGGQSIRQRVIDQARQTLGSNFNQSIDNDIKIGFQQQAAARALDKYNEYLKVQGNRPDQSKYAEFVRQESRDMNRQLANPQYMQQLRDQRLNEFIQTGQGLDRIALNQHDDDWRVREILNKSIMGGDTDAASLSRLGLTQDEINRMYSQASGKYVSSRMLNDLTNTINQRLQEQKANLPKQLSEELQKISGYGFEDYTTAKDLTRESVASDADRARYAALSALAGKQDAKDLAFSKPTEAKAGRDLSRDELRTLLAKLSDTYGRAGSSVAGTAPMGNTVVK